MNRKMTRIPDKSDIFFVGIGASAGGLIAIQQLFNDIPSDTGMSFFIIQHLSPEFKSLMPNLLSKHTSMPIYTLKKNQEIKPNCIYLNTPRTLVRVNKNKKTVSVFKDTENARFPIDYFFKSLGETKKNKALGVILSGTGEDGAEGIMAISENGGLSMVQEPITAQFDGMPNAAISTQFVNFIGSPAIIAKQLVNWSKKDHIDQQFSNELLTSFSDYNKILQIVYKNSGIDFKFYKQNTLLRRIKSRMSKNKINAINEYIDFLTKNKSEIIELKNSFLISVTEFFRDEEAYEIIKNKVIPEICRNKIKDRKKEIRIWIPGCASGEEAYSTAILFDDYIQDRNLDLGYKIFASDIDSNALSKAQLGFFPDKSIKKIDSTILARYFSKQTKGYQVVNKIKKHIIFSLHNLTSSYPFVNMDYVSCRNLLIYINPAAQPKIISNLSYSLCIKGFLLLGKSESIGNFHELYKPIDEKWKVFQKTSKALPDGKLISNPAKTQTSNANKDTKMKDRSNHNEIIPENKFQQYLLEKFSPAAIYIDAAYNIQYISGDVSKRLKFPKGVFSQNLLKMISPELAILIREGVDKAIETRDDVVLENIPSGTENSKVFNINIHHPSANYDFNNALILYFGCDEHSAKAAPIDFNNITLDDISLKKIKILEQKLEETQKKLIKTVEELETSNEELQSTNEELISSNEELQSSNEELHTVNEELFTVNSEYHAKNKELRSLNNDINNLLESTHIATIFLNKELTIRKFTPELAEMFSLKTSDIGRPLSSFASNFNEKTKEQILKDSQEAISSQLIIEKEIRDSKGVFFLRRISPFYNEKNHIEGVVISFISINELKSKEKKLIESNKKLRLLYEQSPDMLVSLSPVNYNIINCNDQVIERLGYQKEQFLKQKFFDLFENESVSNIRKALSSILSEKIDDNIESIIKSKFGSLINVSINMGVIRGENNEVEQIICSLRDISMIIENENKFKLFFENAPVGKSMTSPSGELIKVNEAFAKVLGYSVSEMMHLNFAEITHPDDLAESKNCIVSLLNRSKEEYRFVKRYYHKNGQIVWCDIQTRLLYSTNDQPLYFLTHIIDITDRILAEKEKDQTLKKTLTMFDALNDLVYVADPETYDLVFTNKKFNEVWNIKETPANTKCFALLQGRDKPCEFCNNHIIFNEKPNETYVWEFQNETNKEWFRCADRSIEWIDGRKLRMEVASNITKEKQIRIDLEQSQERYDLATAASNNGIWDWWTNSADVFYSDQWKAQVGYKPDELKNDFSTWEKLLHPEDKDRMLQSVQNFLTEPKEYFIEEFRMKHKNGTYRWIQNRAAAVIDKSGKVVRMFGAHKDITEIKQTQEDLRKKDIMFRGMIENAPDGIVMINQKAEFIFASNSALRMFNYSEKELLQKHPYTLTHPDDLPIVKEQLKRFIKEKNKTSYKAQNRFKDGFGRWRWLESTFSASNDENGNPAIVINFRDIQERKEYEQKLLQAKKMAESANIHKNYFLANMSHEIRTPMNGVIGFADLLKANNIDEEKRKKYLNIIDSNAKQLLNLIDDIIDIAKIEADELKISKSKCELNGHLKDIQTIFNEVKKKKNKSDIEIELHLPENSDSNQIETDCSRLKQVLFNLLGNALKFTEKGKIRFGYTVKDNQYQFFVSDEGIGIPKEKQKEIFERFKQLNYNNPAKYGGTGLGLAISKGIVELLNGNIWLESEVNKGTTFFFTQPIPSENKVEFKKQGKPKGKNMESLEGVNILIAEDDQIVQIYFQEALKDLKANLFFASNGKQAVEKYKEVENIALVLMDIRMPIMNGYEALKEILTFDSSAKVIAQTAYAMPDEKEKCMNSGFKDYLVKPIIRDLLVKKIFHWV